MQIADSQLPALPPLRSPLVPERSDFLEGDAPAADKVQAFLARALEATGADADITAGALVPRCTTQIILTGRTSRSE